MSFSIRLPRCVSLAYLSGFWSLILLMALSSEPAYAEWVLVSSPDPGMTVYADLDTIRRKEDMVKMWILFDFKTPKMVGALA